MLVHMTHVRMEPDEVTVAPAAMSSVFWMVTPTIAAARPERVFRNEMITGMSAPPMRIAKTTPRYRDAAIRASRNAC
ncbi:MAG: hypothetical protein BWY94_01704 [Actinobacteria bacterium ADurb.BinA094]|nr:MAG: hypothetical protein BWY94_01704 [Actinobacteria bacterium ADurb.BinA094]